MKKIVLGIALLLSVTNANAWWYGGYGYGFPAYGYGYGYNGWAIGGAMIGGAMLGYALSRPQVVVEQPVIIQQYSAPVQSQPPYGYHYQQYLDPFCGCYKTTLVPN
jgi:hypothetical protein